MKKFTAKQKEKSLQEVANDILRDSSSIDDVINQGTATKCDNLSVIVVAIDDVARQLSDKAAELTRIDTALSTKREELNQLIVSLPLDTSIGRIVDEINRLTHDHESKLAEIVPLETKRKELVSLKKKYLKEDPTFIDFIEHEGKIGLDLTDASAASGKQVYSIKVVSSYLELAPNVDIAAFIAVYSALKKFVYINLADAANDTDASVIEAINSAKANGYIVQKDIKEIKASTTSKSINTFNWLSDEVEDN